MEPFFLTMKFPGRTVTDEVPNDLAISIFLNLPVKSLVRLRCLSKSYSAVIRSPEFIASHLQKQSQDPQILLKLCRSNLRVDKLYFTTLSADFLPIQSIQMPFFDNNLYDPVVDGPCNGLLILKDRDRFALWNPSTREFKLVPPSRIRRPPETNSTSFDAVGFWFDSRSRECKVIRFITNYVCDDVIGMYGTIKQVEIYCLNSNSWREISAPEGCVHKSSTFRDMENGLYHWSALGTDDALIISFDLTNESFTSTVLPEFEEDYTWDFIAPLDGAMRLIAYPRFVEEKVFDIWLKKDRWIKELSIGPFSNIKQPLGSWKNGQLFLESNNDELLLLEVETEEIKNLGISAYPGKMQVILYTGSLIPVNGRTEEQEGIVRERFLDGQMMRMKM